VTRIFLSRNENDVNITIFYLISKGKDVTVTFCGNDAHLW
jgi:hypothetical protein